MAIPSDWEEEICNYIFWHSEDGCTYEEFIQGLCDAGIPKDVRSENESIIKKMYDECC